MSGGGGAKGNEPNAGLAVIMFLLALIGGTFCSLTSKVCNNLSQYLQHNH
jgi:hypothetical protein